MSPAAQRERGLEIALKKDTARQTREKGHSWSEFFFFFREMISYYRQRDELCVCSCSLTCGGIVKRRNVRPPGVKKCKVEGARLWQRWLSACLKDRRDAGHEQDARYCTPPSCFFFFVYMKQPLIKWRFAADRNEVRGGVTTWRNRPWKNVGEIYISLCVVTKLAALQMERFLYN